MMMESAVGQRTGKGACAVECTSRKIRLRAKMLRPAWSIAAVAAALALGVVPGIGQSIPQSTHDLMEGRGRDVSFPVSCGEDIQPRFDAALAALHSFWYGQALKEFRAIA